MIKLIFSDMDGTLLTSESKLPEGFEETMAELKKRGVTFCPASGRQYFSLIKTFKEYFDEFLFLAENGTIVMQNGKELFSSPMDIKAVEKILEVTAPMKNIMRVWCGKKNAYILPENDTPELRNELNKYFTRTAVVESFEKIDDTPIKIALFDPVGRSKENIYCHLEQFYNSLQVVLSSDYWVDLMTPGSSKGVAIKNVQKILNVKPEECAAFGDYMNDYEMIQAVGYGFAMANAHPDLKKVAKFETLSNDERGVLVGIEKLIDEGLI